MKFLIGIEGKMGYERLLFQVQEQAGNERCSLCSNEKSQAGNQRKLSCLWYYDVQDREVNYRSLTSYSP